MSAVTPLLQSGVTVQEKKQETPRNSSVCPEKTNRTDRRGRLRNWEQENVVLSSVPACFFFPGNQDFLGTLCK